MFFYRVNHDYVYYHTPQYGLLFIFSHQFDSLIKKKVYFLNMMVIARHTVVKVIIKVSMCTISLPKIEKYPMPLY